MELMKNKVYRCRISDYTADGTGFAKIEGRAVFVPRTAVGDCCDVRIVKVTKNVAFGRVEKLVTPSRARITPACPVSEELPRKTSLQKALAAHIENGGTMGSGLGLFLFDGKTIR